GVEFFDWGNNFTTGPLYPTFIFHMIFMAISSFAIMIAKYRKLIGVEKLQLKYLVLGLFVAGTATLFMNLIWPLLSGINNLSKYGPLSMILMIALTAYAITRYRLMDIRIILRRVFVHILVTVSFLTVILGMIFAVAVFLAKRIPDYSLVITGSLAFALVLLLFERIKKLFEKVANKYFFTSLCDYQGTLSGLASELSSLIELNETTSLISKTIENTMQVDRIGIFIIIPKEENKYLTLEIKGFSESDVLPLAKNYLLLDQASKNRRAIILREIKGPITNHRKWPEQDVKKLQEEIERSSAELYLPLIHKNVLTGMIILGRKVSKDAYTQEDLQLLETLSNQAAIAIENSRLYTEVENFSKTLKEKVDEQTKELKNAYNELKRLDEAKSEFISIASHQLRTPLTAIKGYISMVLDGSYGELGTKTKTPLQKVGQASERLIRLVNDLLSLSRIEGGRLKFEPQPIKIEKLINNAVGIFKIEAQKKGISLKLEKPKEPLPEIMADQEKLNQTILNLIDNAIHYTEKGEINISVELITARNKTDDDKIKIEIRDTGRGISPEEIGQLFEKFSRGHDASRFWTEGTGLGLFVAKKFIEMHQGKIWAESEGEDKGSTFHIELPVN
ncbi:MAG: ATP-binding protein, partial [bacterium]|nr:ATP-binding protein [bacterium]